MGRLIKYTELKRYISLVLAMILCFSVLPMRTEAKDYSMSDRIIVSLGDSYSSGEGIEPFYGQDDAVSEKVKNEDWLAHRSENAWAGMLVLPGVSGTMVDNFDTHWFFAASSGATTKHLLNKQKKSYSKGGSLTGHWPSESTVSGTGYVSPQLDVFNELGDRKADYVTLTLGGNDADFAGIIEGVVLGSTYLNLSGLSDKLNSTWDKFYEDGGIGDKLRSSYENIANKAGLQAQIIVAGYPKLLDANGKGFFVSKEEALLVNTAVSNFNNAIEQVVSECSDSGINIHFVSVEKAFEGHGAYSDDSYINEVLFGTKSQDLKDINITSAYSIHPNYDGACAYAKCVQEKIDALERERFVNEIQEPMSNLPVTTLNRRVKFQNFYSDGELYRQYEYVYNELGQCVRVNSYAESGYFFRYYELEYEESGNCVKTTEIVPDSNKMGGYYINEYNSEGQCIRETHYSSSGVENISYLNSYGTDGTCIKSEYYKFSFGRWELQEVTDYTYDLNKRLIRIETHEAYQNRKTGEVGYTQLKSSSTCEYSDKDEMVSRSNYYMSNTSVPQNVNNLLYNQPGEKVVWNTMVDTEVTSYLEFVYEEGTYIPTSTLHNSFYHEDILLVPDNMSILKTSAPIILLD